VAKIAELLAQQWPDAVVELDHTNAYQLLVATILSAQSTDKMINTVTPGLFAKYPDANALAQAEQGPLEKQIHSTGFFRNKARAIVGMARAVVERHGGEIPRTMDELVELPGVARKTANVVLGEAMGIQAGIVLNKMDLVDEDDDGGLGRRLAYLGDIGYPVYKVSTRDGSGLKALTTTLQGHDSMLVGQSGVGKSSLLNMLVPEARHRIDELSAATDEGRHTTTATTLHPLAQGGALVDSPGVRDLELSVRDPGGIGPLFRDIRAAAPGCRFADCLHIREPGCAVMLAVEQKVILESRYSSYKKLVNTMRQAKERKYD